MIIGVAGITKSSYEESFSEIKQLGILACEIEFVYGVRMSDDLAIQVADSAKRHGISLSVHAPYYINLCSVEASKVAASKTRIIDSAKKAELLGARYVVFHPGFYQSQDPDAAYEKVKQAVAEIQEQIPDSVVLCPETTGKVSQFGTVDELVKLSKKTGCGICIDFAHIKARYDEKLSYEDVVKKARSIKHIHMHYSGIEWGDKGEIRHQPIDSADAQKLKNATYMLNCIIINESPNQIEDTIKLVKVFTSGQ